MPTKINTKPGTCRKCNGTGIYKWGWSPGRGHGIHQGKCHACRGTGKQTRAQIERNAKYNLFHPDNFGR